MKGNFLLAMLALGLALLAYAERQATPASSPPASPTESSEPLFAVPVEEIAAVKVMERQECFVVRKEALTSPHAEELLESLLQARVFRRFSPASADFSPYGLALPSRRIAVEETDGGQSQVMDLGSLNPIGNAVYVHVQNETDVLLVGSYFLTSLDMALQGLRAEGNRFVDRNCSSNQAEGRERRE